jgi:ABC-type bacteriocin/lantibiotic exporter with double-glycine peptidase domain
MTLSPIGRFWRILKLYRKEIRQIYIYALFIGIVNLTLPLGIQAIINFLQTGQFTTTWLILVGFVLAGIATTGVIQVLQLRIVENIQQDLFSRSAFEFAYRLPKISFLQLDKIHAPELVNRFFDTLTIQKGLPKILIDFSLAIFQIAFGLILLAIYSPYFIILGLALAFILWVIFKITGPKGLTTSLKESKEKYLLAHWLEEIARVSRSFKLISTEKYHLRKTDGIVEEYLGHRENHFQVLVYQFRLFIAFKVIVAAGLLLLGGFLVFQERMNIGQFVAAEIIIILIINSVEKVLLVTETIYDVLTALDKIGYVTDLELDESGGTGTVQEDKGLSLKAKEIVFGFPDEKRKILYSVSFEIQPNEKVVLAGKSGSGKSLLLQILSGIHEIEDGELYINDIPFANYEREQLHNAFGVILPSNQLFEGTFRDNILLGRKIPEQELAEMLEMLRLDEYLIHQPKGIDSEVDSGGRRLPRSIIQKLHIARLIAGKPKLLLIEDPLEFIEDEEKRMIIDYIMDKRRPWTVMVVSDYYYWEEKCDRVIELDKIQNG